MGAASERMYDRFNLAVESVRIGTVIAHDAKAGQRWRRITVRQQSRPSVGLTGAALEQAIARLAITNPDIVAVRTA